VSKGPDLVVVPNVVGDRVPAAEAAITAAGLAPGGPYGPGNRVFITDPAAGNKIKRGSTVTLYTA
jgi:beta-lactam-binding protein with PASTA domain